MYWHLYQHLPKWLRIQFMFKLGNWCSLFQLGLLQKIAKRKSDPRLYADELGKGLVGELDYTLEAANASQFLVMITLELRQKVAYCHHNELSYYSWHYQPTETLYWKLSLEWEWILSHRLTLIVAVMDFDFYYFS